MKKCFAVFVSGYGRGAIEIIKDFKCGLIKPELKLILSSNPESNAIIIAEENDVACEVVERENFKILEEFELCIITILKKYKIDYIFLAGWMLIIGETLLKSYPNKIVNIHPSILPCFKGLNAIDQALDYGVKITGLTTHYVTESIDGGKIIMQEAVKIEEEDDFKLLDNKIFKTGTILTTKTINKVFV